jgi:hypothetical protein
MVVTERTTAPTVPPLEELHDELRQILLQRKQRAMAVRGVQELIDGYQIRLAPSATSRLFERFNRQDVDPSVFDAGAGDDTVALATYQVNGRARDYTVKDALTDLAEGSEAPAWAMSEQIERWLRGQIMRRAAVLEAERRHLVEDPAVARRFQRRVDDYLIESVTDPLVGGLVASEEEMRAFYERLLQNAPPGSPAFEQLSPADLNQLHDLVVASHKREVLQQFQIQLRGQYPVTVDHAALARVRWPGPITFGQG